MDGDAENCYTDVIVQVKEVEANMRVVKYHASFFTYTNIIELQSQFAKSGEYLKGKYFYAKNMVLIDNCSIKNIRAVVVHMIEEGEFTEVFRRLS